MIPFLFISFVSFLLGYICHLVRTHQILNHTYEMLIDARELQETYKEAIIKLKNYEKNRS